MTNSVAPFDLWQQVYCLSQQSGLLGGQKHEAAADDSAKWLGEQLANFFAAYAEQMGGAWSTVWGPVVFEAEEDRAAQDASNVMYVAANQDRSVFVVAVAGTNFASKKYDVAKEDNAVDTTVAWDAAFPGLDNRAPSGPTPYLSSGAALGVGNLLAMQDGRTGKNLGEYLASAASKSATLIFSGHSLGGALAPTLALALFNSNGGALGKSAWANVRFYSTAGPTPGNGPLAEYVAREFPPTGPEHAKYQCWNRVVWNNLDAVPHGWVVELLEGLPELYPHRPKKPLDPWPPLPLQADVTDKINKSRKGAATGAGAYAQLANQPLDGTPLLDENGDPILMTDMDSWIKQMQYQHTRAYDVLLAVQSVAPSQPAPANR